jgi:hypothetical protein
VKYELGIYTPEDDILHSHRRENLKSYMLYIKFAGCTYHEVVGTDRIRSEEVRTFCTEEQLDILGYSVKAFCSLLWRAYRPATAETI